MEKWSCCLGGYANSLTSVICWIIIGTLRSDNGDGDGNVRSLGRAGPRRVGVPAKIEITNFTSENVDDGH